MIEIMSTTGISTCANCGLPITRMVGDLHRGDGEWSHDPSEGHGTFLRHCPGSPVATPTTADQEADA